jgi:DegV family protein with EDD domain
MVLLGALAAAEAGADADAVVARAEETRAAQQIWFAVDTLDHLRRGGRIGAAQALLGGALKIKPILTMKGVITPVERVRTSGKAFERLVDYARELKEQGSDAWLIQHVQAPEQAAELEAAGTEVFGTARSASRRSAPSSARTSAGAARRRRAAPPPAAALALDGGGGLAAGRLRRGGLGADRRRRAARCGCRRGSRGRG